ncbi:MAG: DnaA/Hda family protein [Litorimonas sp.]
MSKTSLSGQIPFNLRPEPAYNFDNFVKTASNSDALKIVQAWPNWPSATLLLLGPHGSGKTHLGQAWALNTQGVMFVDDAHQQDETRLFDLINRALNGDVKGLMLSAPDVFVASIPDLRSRLGAMPKAVLKEQDDEALEPILRHLFAQTGREVSKDVVDYILKFTDRSVSALRVLVNDLDVSAGAAKTDVTKRFVSRYLDAVRKL